MTRERARYVVLLPTKVVVFAGVYAGSESLAFAAIVALCVTLWWILTVELLP